MQQQFPVCWNYLNAHRTKLQQRNMQGYTEGTWYRYGRSQSLTKFNGAPKLVWPVLSLEPRYVYDEQDIVFTGGGNGPYYALRVLPDVSLSLLYLQAILSHPVLGAMVRMLSSAFRGGYWSYGKQFIKNLPIKIIDFSDPKETAVHDELIVSVQQLIIATQDEKQATTPRQKSVLTKQARLLRKKVETIIAKLYNFSQDDMKLVHEYLIPDEGDTH